MTACSLAVLCDVRRLLCSPTPWTRDAGGPCAKGAGDEPPHSQVLLPNTQRIRRTVDSPERSSGTPWKFWRKLSVRRGDKKAKSSSGHNPGARSQWTHPSHLDLRPPSGAADRGGCQSSLPDVVERGALCRSSSLKAPPKPPRLFLFRSSSINHPRSSLDGGSARSSMLVAEGDSGVDVLAEAEPIYVNSAFGAALNSGLSANDRIIPPSINNNNNNNNNDENYRGTGLKTADVKREDMEVVRKQPQYTAVQGGVDDHGTPPPSIQATPPSIQAPPPSPPSFHTLPHRSRRAPRHRLASPQLGGRHGVGGRARGEGGRQRQLVAAVTELLCQRLDPFPLLGMLQEAGVLTPADVTAFRGHPDRRLIVESVAGAVGSGQSWQLTAFLEVVSGAGAVPDVVRLLEAMQALDRLALAPTPDTDHLAQHQPQVLADERTVAYEVGYLAPDGRSLRPLLELERARPPDRRPPAPRDPPSAPPAPAGPVMLSACVTGYDLSGERAVGLAEVIRAHHCILELRLGKTQLGGGDLVAVCGALAHNPSLTALDIRLNGLDFVGAVAVGRMVGGTRSLRQLNLSSTGLDVAGCCTVLTALATNRSLTDLDLSFLDVGDAVCDAVRDALRANGCLQRLRLRSNNFSPAGCQALAEGLQRNRSLLELDLSRNGIGNGGVEALARHVPDSALTHLSLENCGVTAGGCEGLAQMVGGSRGLRALDLSVNLLGDAGVAKLGPALERSSVMHTLGLNMCGITNDGLAGLLDVLEKNASIALLKLCYNRLGREHRNPAATSDNLRYRLRIVTSSKPKLKILLWGNSFEQA